MTTARETLLREEAQKFVKRLNGELFDAQNLRGSIYLEHLTELLSGFGLQQVRLALGRFAENEITAALALARDQAFKENERLRKEIEELKK